MSESQRQEIIDATVALYPESEQGLLRFVLSEVNPVALPQFVDKLLKTTET